MSEIETYRKWVSLSKSKNTALAYMGTVRDFTAKIGKQPGLASLEDIVNYLSQIERAQSSKSYSRHAYALRNFYGFLGSALANKIPTPAAFETYIPKWLYPERVEALVNSTDDVLKRAVLQTSYDLALRVNEVPLLNRDWLLDHTMKVVRLKRRGLKEDLLPISERSSSILEEYLSQRGDDCPALFISRSMGDIRRISHDVVNRIFLGACRRVGIKDVSFHALRHSRVTHMAIDMIRSTGYADHIRLAKFAGHGNINSTLVYVHLASIYLAKSTVTGFGDKTLS